MNRRQSEEERCAEYAQFLRISAAFKAGDLAALREAVDDPDSIPNGVIARTIRSCLEYAVYHSPIAFIRVLLQEGANPTPPDGEHAGFPPLIAALSCCAAAKGAAGRTDIEDLLAVLLEHGADPHQRGINDYTALHMAVAVRLPEAVKVLLAAGADPSVRTRIDECETPREMAERAGLAEIAQVLKTAEGG